MAKKKKTGTSKKTRSSKTTKKKVTKKAAGKTAKKVQKKVQGKKGKAQPKKSKAKPAASSPGKKSGAARGAGKKGGRGSGGLTAAEIEAFRARLLDRRSVILGNLSKLEVGALRASEQDPSVDNMADYGTDNFEQDFTLGLMENVEAVLQEIDDALARIDEGTYGVCEGCSCNIPKARLKAIPYARFCVNCQSEMEKLV